AWPATAAQAATARRTRFPRSMAGESLPWKRSRPARAALEAEVDEHLRGRPQEVLVAFRDAEVRQGVRHLAGQLGRDIVRRPGGERRDGPVGREPGRGHLGEEIDVTPGCYRQ